MNLEKGGLGEGGQKQKGRLLCHKSMVYKGEVPIVTPNCLRNSWEKRLTMQIEG